MTPGHGPVFTFSAAAFADYMSPCGGVQVRSDGFRFPDPDETIGMIRHPDRSCTIEEDAFLCRCGTWGYLTDVQYFSGAC